MGREDGAKEGRRKVRGEKRKHERGAASEHWDAMATAHMAGLLLPEAVDSGRPRAAWCVQSSRRSVADGYVQTRTRTRTHTSFHGTTSSSPCDIIEM